MHGVLGHAWRSLTLRIKETGDTFGDAEYEGQFCSGCSDVYSRLGYVVLLARTTDTFERVPRLLDDEKHVKGVKLESVGGNVGKHSHFRVS